MVYSILVYNSISLFILYRHFSQKVCFFMKNTSLKVPFPLYTFINPLNFKQKNKRLSPQRVVAYLYIPSSKNESNNNYSSTNSANSLYRSCNSGGKPSSQSSDSEISTPFKGTNISLAITLFISSS